MSPDHSDESRATDAKTVPVRACRICGAEVPVATFCGLCGSHLVPRDGEGPTWLRVRSYGAVSGEHLARLAVVSSLFPHLPSRSRSAFRVGLTLLVLALVVLAVLRWQAALVAVSALGFPAIFWIYLEESDVYGDDDLPVQTLLLAGLPAAVIGIGWALWTGPMVADSFLIAGARLTAHRLIVDALVIPVAGALLMIVPAVLLRLSKPRNLESLDGFLIGSLAAVAFTAAGTMTRLAPQLLTGMVADDRTIGSLVVEAGIQGIALPLTAAAAGGMVGAALWFAPRTENGHPFRTQWVIGIVPAVLTALAVYALMGLIDVSPLTPVPQLVAHLVIAILAVLALRVGVHIALLRETHDELAGDPVTCAECHHVVPDMAFCPNCGVAMRASSRSSRAARRLADPEAADPTGPR